MSPVASRRWIAARHAALVLAPGLLALLAPRVGSAMEALYARIDPGDPYFAGADLGLQYLALPLAVLGAGWLVLAPGWLLARSFALGRSFAETLPFALALSLLVLAPATAALQALFGGQGLGGELVASALAIGALAAAVLIWRAGDGRAADVVQARGREPWIAIASALALVVALTPKFFWESFNGDGAHAFEASRLLLNQPLPFWPEGSGEVGGFPGLSSVLFLYPNAWFLRLFGPTEAAVRLPFALYLVVLYGCLVAAIEQGAPRRLSGGARALIGAGVASYALVMAYSATYDPYSADIALPATQDTLSMIVFLGAVLAHGRGSRAWTFAFAALTLLASPNGPLLLGAWGAGLAFSSRAAGWRPVLRFALPAAAAFAVLLTIVPVLQASGLPVPGGEHSSFRLLSKLRQLQLTGVQRLVFLVLPAGIYPALGLLRWRSSDPVARAWIVTTALVFGLYYLLAIVSLHYFVPVMLTPLIVFWRQRLFARPDDAALLQRPAFAGCAASAVLAGLLALPVERSICTAGRDVGETVAIEGLGGYEASDPRTFQAAELLSSLFAPGWYPEVPLRAYAGSALVWNHYARRRTGDEVPVYRLQAPSCDDPNAEKTAANEVAELFVLDPARWAEQRAQRPRGSRGPALYRLPREVLFRYRPGKEGAGAASLSTSRKGDSR